MFCQRTFTDLLLVGLIGFTSIFICLFVTKNRQLLQYISVLKMMLLQWQTFPLPIGYLANHIVLFRKFWVVLLWQQQKMKTKYFSSLNALVCVTLSICDCLVLLYNIDNNGFYLPTNMTQLITLDFPILLVILVSKQSLL